MKTSLAALSLCCWLLAAAPPLPAPPAPVAEPPASPSPAPSASPAPIASPTGTPAAAPTRAPSTSPQPPATSTPQPSTSLTPAPTPPVLPPDAPPEIVALSLSTTVFWSGETVSGSVVTSTNVASVELRVEGISIDVPRVTFGEFAMTYHIPRIPRIVHRRGYTMRVIARNTRGDATERDIPVTLK